MRVLAIDLGSQKVGWAYLDGDQLLAVGVWRLTSPRDRSQGVRWLVLDRNLRDIVNVSRLQIDLVAFEEVMNHTGRGKKGKPVFHVKAAHAYGGAKAHLTRWCEENGFEFTSVPVGNIKRAATGKGGGKGTSKDAVMKAAEERWPHHKFETDDASDAAFIGLAAQIELGLIHTTYGRQS